jgi:secreted trypsin-like serine protease
VDEEVPVVTPKDLAPQPKYFEQENGTNVAEGKILAGTPVGGIMYPWMAAILYDGSHICSGTLISRQWIMTAAHCVTF